MSTTVIIGAGQAGNDIATSLRQLKYDGRIVLIGDEPVAPYRRPPLSKAYLSGDIPEEKLYIKPRDAYTKHDIELRTGEEVTAIDREARHLRLASGESMAYDKLALTTGGRARRLPLEGVAP